MEQNNSERDEFADLLAEYPAILWFAPVRVCMNLEDSGANGVTRSLHFGLRLEPRCELLAVGGEHLEGAEFSLLLRESNGMSAHGRFSHWPPSRSSVGEDHHLISLEVRVCPDTFQPLVAYCLDGRLPVSVRVDVMGLLRGPSYDGGDYRMPKNDGRALPVVGIGFQLPLVEPVEQDEGEDEGAHRQTAPLNQSLQPAQLEKAIDRLRVTLVERSRIIISWMVVILLVLLFK